MKQFPLCKKASPHDTQSFIENTDSKILFSCFCVELTGVFLMMLYISAGSRHDLNYKFSNLTEAKISFLIFHCQV